MMITAQFWSDRELGTNDDLAFANETTCCATGINLQVGRSMPRRCYAAKLYSSSDCPWREKRIFKHKPLFPWILEHREEILTAVFILTRHWIQSGRPIPNDDELPIVGGFDEWRDTIGGILIHASKTIGAVKDNRWEILGRGNIGAIGENFLGNLDETYKEYDKETPQMHDFLAKLFETRPLNDTTSSTFTTGDIVDEITAYSSHLTNVLPIKVEDAWRKGGNLSNVLGSLFSRVKDRIFPDGYTLHKQDELKDGYNLCTSQERPQKSHSQKKKIIVIIQTRHSSQNLNQNNTF